MASGDTALLESTRIVGQDSWVLRNDSVRIALTHNGGHMAPVGFSLPNGVVAEPYYVSPWGADDLAVPADEPCVAFLRGDFFCLPFGAASAHGADRSLLHGEPSYAPWQVRESEANAAVAAFAFTLQTEHPRGSVTKRIFLVEGQTAIYLRHELTGYDAAFPAGHHATLAMPDEPETVLVGLSPYRYGATWPAPFGDPARAQSYYALAVNERFATLGAVPLIFKDPATGACDAFPTRRGYTDGLACVTQAGADPAWVTATFTTRGYLWFALKNAADFPVTVLWMANGGRHASPWNGRENCLGLEDVRGFFAAGWKASVEPNSLSDDGVPTAFAPVAGESITLNYIQGVVATPLDFGRVASAIFEPGAVRFRDERGAQVRARVDHSFLRGSAWPAPPTDFDRSEKH